MTMKRKTSGASGRTTSKDCTASVVSEKLRIKS
jgi:hypothetical protein